MPLNVATPRPGNQGWVPAYLRYKHTLQICIIHLNLEPMYPLITVTFKNNEKYISQAYLLLARNFSLNHITTLLLQPLRIHHLPFLSALQ